MDKQFTVISYGAYSVAPWIVSDMLAKLNNWSPDTGIVLNMASEAAQNFLQPLSSWMSQIYEAIQQAGDSISASLLNLSGVGRKSEEERNQDLENNGGVYEDYSEESDDEQHLDLWDEEYLYPREDVPIGGPDLASQDLPHGSDVGQQRQKQVKNIRGLPEQCVESTRSLTANGSYWTNEDLQPLDQLPPITEEEGEPSMKTGSHQHNLSLGGSLKSNNGKASFAGKQLARTLTVLSRPLFSGIDLI